MTLPKNIPNEAKFEEVEEFDNFDSRVSAIDCLFINIIGVNENSVEFIPNIEEQNEEEYLAWLWLIKPSLGNEIILECSKELSKLINSYNSNKMESWFEYIST